MRGQICLGHGRMGARGEPLGWDSVLGTGRMGWVQALLQAHTWGSCFFSLKPGMVSSILSKGSLITSEQRCQLWDLDLFPPISFLFLLMSVMCSVGTCERAVVPLFRARRLPCPDSPTSLSGPQACTLPVKTVPAALRPGGRPPPACLRG